MTSRFFTRWRPHLPLFAMATGVFAILAFFLSYEECDAPCSDWDFVDDLLLQETADHKIWRWGHSPLVVVKDGNSAEVDMVSGAVYELNEVLSKTGMTVRFTTREEPTDITVTFVSKETLDRSGQKHDLDTRIMGLSESYASDDGQLWFARVLVLRNLSQGDKWGAILHELGHAMGIKGHTDRYISSLIHQDFRGGAHSDGFSSDDRKLLEFLYLRVQPDARETVVRAAFDEHWVTRSQ